MNLKLYKNFILESDKPDEVTWEEEPEADDEDPDIDIRKYKYVRNQEDFAYLFGEQSDTECEINGYRIQYDGAGGDKSPTTGKEYSLEHLKDFYKGWVYIGSGYDIYSYGKKIKWEDLHYFFIKPENLKLR